MAKKLKARPTDPFQVGLMGLFTISSRYAGDHREGHSLALKTISGQPHPDIAIGNDVYDSHGLNVPAVVVGTVAGLLDLQHVTVTTFAVAQRGEQLTLSSRERLGYRCLNLLEGNGDHQIARRRDTHG